MIVVSRQNWVTKASLQHQVHLSYAMLLLSTGKTPR